MAPQTQNPSLSFAEGFSAPVGLGMLVVVNGSGMASRVTADPVAAADVPFWVVTATLAAPANPAGTMATILVGELTTKAALLPPTVTWVAPEKRLKSRAKSWNGWSIQSRFQFR